MSPVQTGSLPGLPSSSKQAPQSSSSTADLLHVQKLQLGLKCVHLQAFKPQSLSRHLLSFPLHYRPRPAGLCNFGDAYA